MKRTHPCGLLGKSDVGKKVVLCGWVHSRRDHGGVLFLDVRDREGVVQVVANPDQGEVYGTADGLRSEFVVEVEGAVRLRPEGTQNPSLPTGDVEVVAGKITVLNQSKTLPFEISQYSEASEEVRLQHRFLDLRRPALQRNLAVRHKISQAVRKALDGIGFLEIETPFLTKSTPEGARDFLVPSRLNPGSFYALPQSPQLFKQILMVGGMEKYYQIARCFRDEDLRSDRQPEFTQIDLEMSFVDEGDVMAVTERILSAAFAAATGRECLTPFPRLAWKEAMDRFGSDKPDLRFGCELADLSGELRGVGFQVFASALEAGGAVKALVFPGGAGCSRADIDSLTDYVKKLGAKGLAWMKIADSGPESNIVKFFSKGYLDAILQKTGAVRGDLIFFGAGSWRRVVGVLGMLRTELSRRYKLIPEKPVPDFRFLWVVDFPLLEWDEAEKRWNAMHHPFTSPVESQLARLEEEPGKVGARAYDIVLNGSELGGGSIRIHRRDVQEKVFKTLGISESSAREKFGFLLNALDFGAPPHGGIALGLDRMVAIFLGEDSIRDTIAFPKTQKGLCLLSGSPSPVTPKQLEELSLRTVLPKKPA